MGRLRLEDLVLVQLLEISAQNSNQVAVLLAKVDRSAGLYRVCEKEYTRLD